MGSREATFASAEASAADLQVLLDGPRAIDDATRRWHVDVVAARRQLDAARGESNRLVRQRDALPSEQQRTRSNIQVLGAEHEAAAPLVERLLRLEEQLAELQAQCVQQQETVEELENRWRDAIRRR